MCGSDGSNVVIVDLNKTLMMAQWRNDAIDRAFNRTQPKNGMERNEPPEQNSSSTEKIYCRY